MLGRVNGSQSGVLGLVAGAFLAGPGGSRPSGDPGEGRLGARAQCALLRCSPALGNDLNFSQLQFLHLNMRM